MNDRKGEGCYCSRREVWFTRSMMTFNIFALDTCDFNIDMFEIFQVSSENIREIFMKKKFISDD